MGQCSGAVVRIWGQRARERERERERERRSRACGALFVQTMWRGVYVLCAFADAAYSLVCFEQPRNAGLWIVQILAKVPCHLRPQPHARNESPFKPRRLRERKTLGEVPKVKVQRLYGEDLLELCGVGGIRVHRCWLATGSRSALATRPGDANRRGLRFSRVHRSAPCQDTYLCPRRHLINVIKVERLPTPGGRFSCHASPLARADRCGGTVGARRRHSQAVAHHLHPGGSSPACGNRNDGFTQRSGPVAFPRAGGRACVRPAEQEPTQAAAAVRTGVPGHCELAGTVRSAASAARHRRHRRHGPLTWAA